MHKDLIKKYLLNAEEKLSVAEYLLKGKFYKDSMSRSYYSMFFAAKALLATKEIYSESHSAAEPQPNPNLTVGKGGLSL